MSLDIPLISGRELRSYTTLHIGGPARAIAEPATVEDLVRTLMWASAEELPVLPLGEGSNVLVADRGWDGLVVRFADRSLEVTGDGGTAQVRAGAGLGWDALVAATVEADLAGLECTSGIPGLVGAAPIQNVGAYGQEVAERIVTVEAVDRQTGDVCRFPASECDFAYRDSRFKGSWSGRFFIVAVEFELHRGGPPAVRYAELRRRLQERDRGAEPTLGDVRDLVIAIRRDKSMVLDPRDPDSRSAGSFFTNPIVDPDSVAETEAALERRGVDPTSMPRWPSGAGRTKLSAAWLMEAAGLVKGQRVGGAAISRKHVLALTNRGGATAADVVALASQARRAVRDAFGITLVPEPTFVGFDRTVDELLG